MTLKQRGWALCATLVVLLAGALTAKAQTGQATLIFINFVGSEMILTLDEQLYTVPGVDTQPDGGRLTINLPPGQHIYSGHIPGGPGNNGMVELAAGQTVVLGARLDESPPVLSKDDIVLQKPQKTLVFFEASLTPPAPTVESTPVPLGPLPPGQGGLVLVNYIGEALLVDIAGDLYTVPANDRRQIILAPGEVVYSANVGAAHLNGTVLVTAGGYTGLGFTRELPTTEPDFEVGEPLPTQTPLKLSVFPVSLAVELNAEPTVESTPGTSAASATQPETEPASPAIPSTSTSVGATSLMVVNYIGETVTFTIDDNVYSVPGSGGEQPIQLPSGEYTFTASTPGTASNGSLQISAGAPLKVSIALNVSDNRIEVYIE